MRARVFAQWSHAYADLAGHLLAGDLLPAAQASPEDVELAFSVLERRRARSLLDQLDAAQATPVVAPQGPLRERRARLLADLATVQRHLADPGLPESERKRLLGELDRLEAEEGALREETARAHPAFASLHKPTFPSLREVREALREEEALLAFQIAGAADPPKASGTAARGFWS